MKKITLIHFMRIGAMPATFLISVILIFISIDLFGAPSVVTPPLLISIYLIIDFLVIYLLKGDVFKVIEDSTRFKIWQTIYKIIFIIDTILAPILLITGIITTVQNILERC